MAQIPPPYLRPRPHRGHTHVNECSCEFLGDESPDWPACVEDDPALNVEAHGSHAGLVYNSQVDQLFARPLTEGEDTETGGGP